MPKRCTDSKGTGAAVAYRQRRLAYAARAAFRRRVRAAFCAASWVVPMRRRVAAARFPAAFGERLVPWRRSAESFAWRDSADLEAAP